MLLLSIGEVVVMILIGSRSVQTLVDIIINSIGIAIGLRVDYLWVVGLLFVGEVWLDPDLLEVDGSPGEEVASLVVEHVGGSGDD